MNRYATLVAIACSTLMAGCHPDSDSAKPEVHVHGGLQYGEFDCTTRATPAPDLETIDTSMTPRADALAEELALEASGEFIAPEGLYQRVSAELTGIKARFPGMMSGALSCLSNTNSSRGFGSELRMNMNETAYSEISNGTYDEWNGLNDNLRATVNVPGPPSHPYLVKLLFEGRYNIRNLTDAYNAVPGVIYAESPLVGPGVGGGDYHYDTCLTVRDEFHYYISHIPSEHCNNGICDYVDYHGFETDASGNIRYLGVYRRDFVNEEPAWFSELQDCIAFLIPWEWYER